jgi:protein-S-isoprenylcysteine O-methyltransferase Ste14
MSLSTLWQILFYLWLASEILLVILTRTRRGSGEVHDRGSLLILWPTIFLSIWIAIAYGTTHPHTMLATTHLSSLTLRWIGVGLLALGLAIRWTAILSLGRSFSVNVAIHAAQTVHRRGLYRLVRHPSYTGALLCLAAVGVETRNWLALAIVLIPTTAAFLYRIHVEEAALHRAFGPDYATYSRSTKRLFPGLY